MASDIALSRNIPCDRGVLILATDLIDLVYINDSQLATLHVAVGGLQQLQDDVLYILAHVAAFGEGSRVVGPIRRIFDLDSSTSVLRSLFMWMRLQ